MCPVTDADRSPGPPFAASRSPLVVGAWTALASAVLLLAFAASVDLPRMSGGFKGDEATYYSLAHSLAGDLDFEYRRQDLERVWREYPGPQGVFLKKGRSVWLRFSGQFPFVAIEKGPDDDPGRLYYAKAYIYPLAAAPFVWLFGTGGFLVLHALLLATCIGAAASLLRVRGIPSAPAVMFALVFFGASVVPVYFFWMTPELFNLSAATWAALLWAYKETVPANAPAGGRATRFLTSGASNWGAAVLIGVLTYSKPTHAVLMVPMVGLAVVRRQWRQAAVSCVLTAATAGALFLGNLAITGDANYQGGDRKTFSSRTGAAGSAGFPFATSADTFDTTGSGHATDDVPVGVLVGSDTLTVFRHNIWYFLVGRHSGLVPYGFPGALSLVLFVILPHQRRVWQWLSLLALVAAAALLLLYMPYTFSGGGGPIGNRYYLGMYAWFLLLVPPFRRPVIPVAAAAVGLLFVAPLLASPFETSRDPGHHVKSGPLRALPIELTTLNDLPVAARPDRARLAMGGDPPMRAYFPDDNVFAPEGGRFWVRGRARSDVILRAPARTNDAGVVESLRIAFLDVEVENGGAVNTVSINTGAGRAALSLAPFESGRIRLAMPPGVPYRPWTYPVNYTYVVSVTAADGFVPALLTPASADTRLLGALVRFSPTYEAAR